ncbi:hypothetical protein EV379_3376 [Microterricola gilva]|uniref:Uncharacterized protein n=1 Tax=Microterricola gilva TaxID=393267 RepID=A0A4Q8ARW5_9MICO|nr:hypothetical protein [Microterricola gilva]RZU67001.1 hypothetical protein EV379_3376 [Microterricola gilva]
MNVIRPAGDDGPEAASPLVLGWRVEAADGLCASTEARLDGIRALLADIAPDVAGWLPEAPASWRSRASAAYAARLQTLHARLDAALGALHEAEAAAWRELVAAQEERERLRWLLQSAGIGRTGPAP